MNFRTFLPAQMDPDAAVFTVTTAARLADMHPQTLRGYDRLGLVVPTRSKGRGRRYTLRDIARLRHIQRLSQDEGINLEGIRRILDLERQVEQLQDTNERLVELLQRLDEQRETRTFHVAGTGLVNVGRRSRGPRALTTGR